MEFRKGPYYTDVSDFSSAGAAFFTTAQTLDTGIIKTGLGQHGFEQLLYADSFVTSRGDLLVGTQYQKYDGPWVGVREDLNKYTGVLRYSESTPEVGEWGLMLMAYDASWNSADQVPQRAVEAGTVSRLGTIDDTVGGATSRYSLSGRWHRDFGEKQLTVRAYVIDYELDLFSNFTYFLNDPVAGDQIEQVDDRMVYGGDVVWQISSSETLVHRIGATLRYDDIDDLGLFKSSQQQRLDTFREDQVRQVAGGIYYNVDTAWSDLWRTSMGVRADYYRFNVHESNIPENAGKTDDWLISPKLNVVRTLTDSAEAYFSAGYAFHSNDARGTVIQTDPASGEPLEPVQPLVRSKGAELGFRVFLDDRLNVSAALWILDLDSELLFVGDEGGTTPNRPSRRYGLEIPVYYQYKDWLMFDFELALTESSYTGSSVGGDEIPGSLSTVVAAGVVAQFDNNMYSSLRVRHFGDRPLTEDGTIRSSDSTVVNLGVGYRVGNFDRRSEPARF
jgi:hypothetical protein